MRAIEWIQREMRKTKCEEKFHFEILPIILIRMMWIFSILIIFRSFLALSVGMHRIHFDSLLVELPFCLLFFSILIFLFQFVFFFSLRLLHHLANEFRVGS